jgi:hypothetical protein
MERLVIRVYDLIPDLTVNDPCVTKTDQQFVHCDEQTFSL